ncbi:MAG: TlpA family protein disulfide reductase [Janthinobacterium lividum]
MPLSSRPLIACLLLGALPLAAGCDRKSPDAAQANAATANESTANGAAPATSPDEAMPTPAPASAPVGGIDRSHAGQPAPTIAFRTIDGKPQTLASYRGKPLLLNLWATWCAPCVKEMPTLDALAAREAGRLVVLPVSQDMGGAAKVVPYIAKAGFKTLKPALDPAMGLSLAYQANLPTSILFGSGGKEVWRYAGDLDWTGAKAKALLAEAK